MEVSTPASVAFIAVLSLVEFASAADRCAGPEHCVGKNGFGVAVGVISFVAAVAYLLADYFDPYLAESIDLYVGAFLVVWWSVGVAINTGAGGLFPTTGNGYFASWGCFLGSVQWTYHSYQEIYGAPPDDKLDADLAESDSP
mmetsp:Transcript_31549/g.77300  ORF Transcript_31549/g.77300 Transcript_31549/m.77300 type:complete len:142 (-) Transcript_31549:79-504(-)